MWTNFPRRAGWSLCSAPRPTLLGPTDHEAARVAICERMPRNRRGLVFLTYLGWSHTEAGNLAPAARDRARVWMRRRRPCRAPLAHAMFEQGDAATAKFSSGLLRTTPPRLAQRHLCWHGRIVALETAIGGRACAYKQRISRPSRTRAVSPFRRRCFAAWRKARHGLTSRHMARNREYTAQTCQGAAFRRLSLRAGSAAPRWRRQKARVDELRAEMRAGCRRARPSLPLSRRQCLRRSLRDEVRDGPLCHI